MKIYINDNKTNTARNIKSNKSFKFKSKLYCKNCKKSDYIKNNYYQKYFELTFFN